MAGFFAVFLFPLWCREISGPLLRGAHQLPAGVEGSPRGAGCGAAPHLKTARPHISPPRLIHTLYAGNARTTPHTPWVIILTVEHLLEHGRRRQAPASPKTTNANKKRARNLPDNKSPVIIPNNKNRQKQKKNTADLGRCGSMEGFGWGGEGSRTNVDTASNPSVLQCVRRSSSRAAGWKFLLSCA